MLSDSNRDSNAHRSSITRETPNAPNPRQSRLLRNHSTPEKATYRIRNQQVAGSIPAGGSRPLLETKASCELAAASRSRRKTCPAIRKLAIIEPLPMLILKARSAFSAAVFLAVFGAIFPAASAAAKHVVREDIEWLDVWLPNTNDHDLPRILLIGDSITRGYGKQVEANLKGKAYVSRLATSKSLGDPMLLDQVVLVLKEQSFDIIHFNNGLHGDGYTEREYEEALPKLLATLRRYAPRAKLIWASSTDVRRRNRLDEVDPKTERVVERNRAAAEVVSRARIPIDDLFSLVGGHPDYHVQDGVHFNEKGVAVLAAQVSNSLEKLLSELPTHR